MDRRQQNVARRRQKKLLRRKQRERNRRGSAPSVGISRQLAERLEGAYALIHRNDFAEADELLRKLDDRVPDSPAIIEALVSLYQAMEDHERCCLAAKRLVNLRPRDADALVIYAQESMLCGRVATARLNYQRFVEQWPDHRQVSKAQCAIAVLEPEIENRISATGFAPDCGLEWLILHEESLSLLHDHKYSACAEKCRELLAKVPTFAPARNNLAIACFHDGHPAEAVAVLEETRQLVPANRFAEVTLAKLYFLTGRAADAHRLADQILANPPKEPDPLMATWELLGFLGRDQDLLELAERPVDEKFVDKHCRAAQHHYLAYAKCRLGDERGARESWKKCLKTDPPLSEARENLHDLDSVAGHAPWFNSFGNWIAQATMDEITKNMLAGEASTTPLTAISNVPKTCSRQFSKPRGCIFR